MNGSAEEKNQSGEKRRNDWQPCHPGVSIKVHIYLCYFK